MEWLGGDAMRKPITMRALIPACTVAALSAIASIAFTRLYSSARLLELMLGAVGVALMLSLVLRTRRAALSAALLTSMVFLAGYLFFAVAMTRPPGAGSAPALLTDALGNAGARMLASTIPIDAVPDTVVLPIFLVWVATLGGVELALRSGALLAAFAPPTCVYVLALLFAGPNAQAEVRWAIVYVVVGIVGIAAGTRSPRARGLERLPAQARRWYRIRRLVFGAAGLVLIIIATVAVGPAVAELSTQRPADPRSHVSAPQQQLPESNPLARLSAWARSPQQPLFTVKTDHPSRISWVVLTDYDGLMWTPGGEYHSSGSVLPVRNVPGPSSAIDQEYTMVGLNGVWLPAIDQARQVTQARVSYNPATGTLLYPQGTKTGLRYDVRSRVPQQNAAALDDARLSRSPVIRQYAKRPSPVPKEVERLAYTTVQKANTPYQQALLLERYIHDNHTFSVKAPSGHGLANLRFFLTTDPKAGGHRGTSEQFATAFALLARIVGLPTRIVVGFHAGSKQDNGRYLVKSGDAFAWPEVYFDGPGWVAFDPTPAQGKDATLPADEQTAQAKQRLQEKQRQLQQLKKPGTQPSRDSHASAVAHDPYWIVGHLGTLAAAVGVAAGGVVVVALIAVFIARRSLRRRRLRRGSESHRITGAWHEIVDALRLAGRWPGAAATASDVAAAAAVPVAGYHKQPPLVSVISVADAVNAAAFALGLVSTNDVTSAVYTADEYRRQLRRRRSWWRRWWWSLTPQPLIWARARPHSAVVPPRRDVQTGSEGASSSLDSTVTTLKQ